mgnify:CR=1 FL=1|tara:strand:+ start:1513 stop:1866 length:354 start_codon:yes stop_codon:yes gene_type:complete
MKVIDIHPESEFDQIRCLICGTPSLDENSEVIDCGHLVLSGINILDEEDIEDLIDRYHFKKEYMKNKNKYNSFFDFLDSYLDDSFVYIRLIDLEMSSQSKQFVYIYNIYEFKKPEIN